MDPYVCCLLQICCDSPAEQQAALVKGLIAEGVPEAAAEAAATALLKHFDLAPKGFGGIVNAIAKMAQTHGKSAH